jgi:hypothetical protein
MEGIDTLINADFMSKGANSGGNWFPTTSELEDWKNRNSMDSRPSSNIVPNNNLAPQNDLSTMPFGSQERINEYKARGWAMDETTHPNIREDYGIPADDPIHYINPDLDPSINPEAGYQDPNNVSGISSVDEALSTQEYTNNVAEGDSTLANNILQKAYENDGMMPEVNPEAGYQSPNAIPFSDYNAPYNNPDPFRTGVSEMPTFPYTDPSSGLMYFSEEDFLNPMTGPGTPLHNQMLRENNNIPKPFRSPLHHNVFDMPQPNPQIKYNADKKALEDELIKLYVDNLGK